MSQFSFEENVQQQIFFMIRGWNIVLLYANKVYFLKTYWFHPNILSEGNREVNMFLCILDQKLR